MQLIHTLNSISAQSRSYDSGPPKSRYLTNRSKSGVYPRVAHETITHRQMAAADRLRLHTLRPWSGGNDAAANQPLPSPTTSSRPIGESICSRRWPYAKESMSARCTAPLTQRFEAPTFLGSVWWLNRMVPTLQPPTSRPTMHHPVQQESIIARRQHMWDERMQSAGGVFEGGSGGPVAGSNGLSLQTLSQRALRLCIMRAVVSMDYRRRRLHGNTAGRRSARNQCHSNIPGSERRTIIMELWLTSVIAPPGAFAHRAKGSGNVPWCRECAAAGHRLSDSLRRYEG